MSDLEPVEPLPRDQMINWNVNKMRGNNKRHGVHIEEASILVYGNFPICFLNRTNPGVLMMGGFMTLMLFFLLFLSLLGGNYHCPDFLSIMKRPVDLRIYSITTKVLHQGGASPRSVTLQPAPMVWEPFLLASSSSLNRRVSSGTRVGRLAEAVRLVLVIEISCIS